MQGKMSLVREMDAEMMAVLDTIESDAKQVALLIWGAMKGAAGAAEQSVIAAIPGMTQRLKTYASLVVQQIATDAQFMDVVGHWKAGVAAARVWALLKAEFPQAEKLGALALQGA